MHFDIEKKHVSNEGSDLIIKGKGRTPFFWQCFKWIFARESIDVDMDNTVVLMKCFWFHALDEVFICFYR